MKYIKLFEAFVNESAIDPEQEAQDILDDILSERDPEELATMTMEDALETVEAYGHTGQDAKNIAAALHAIAEGL
jgi:hypothetical protein